jgi:VanZ family protein
MAWRFLCILQFYCLLALYTYLGVTPHPEASVPVFNDLLMHFAGYIVAGISISFARPLWPVWQRALFLVAFSFAIEIAQHFNPPRTFSWSDMLANSGGVILGLAIVWVLQKYLLAFSRLLYFNTGSAKN